MKGIASQLVLKWARKGSGARFLATDEFTRLTLDSIALCAMDYRFNSFYQDGMHPFVNAMLNVLTENGSRAFRPQPLTMLRFSSNNRFLADQKYMRSVSKEIIEYRRTHPTEKKDLLDTMLHGVDPKTGQPLRDDLIQAQMIGFLVAGAFLTAENPSKLA
jgi:cytochrome P450 / NADPH-cytochrome P450 reductase